MKSVKTSPKDDGVVIIPQPGDGIKILFIRVVLTSNESLAKLQVLVHRYY